MLRAILDPNVIVSALLSPSGAPGELLRRWREGHFDVVLSPALIAELERVLRYPKLARRIPPHDAALVVATLLRHGVQAPDPPGPPQLEPPDPGDAYLVALAEAERCALVSGDRGVLSLAERAPIFAPRQFLTLLDR